MADDEEFCAYVKAYIKAKTEVTIPDLQRELSSDYLTVARAVQKLSSEGVLQFDSGITFRVVSQSEKNEKPSHDREEDEDESYLRAREQKFIKRMGLDRLKSFHNDEDEKNNREDEEDEIDDDDYDDGDEEDDYEDLDDASPEIRGRICIEVPRIISERGKVQAEKLILGANKGWDKTNALCFAIGKNVDGEYIYGDLTRLIHILVGGSSGSGKSMFLHAMIDSFIMRYSPDEVRLILCDAKKTEFANYEGMPYLLTGQIVTEAKEMIRAIRWAHKEMERRYCLFEAKTSEGGIVRNIDEYNAARKAGEAKLPRIVIIVDEYADFVTVAKRDIEEAVQFLAQKSRAAGIHLVFATRRPSEKVVTGTLKSNFPTRIAFRMTQEAHSRTILDESGAEKLLGFGDMLIRRASDFRCERIQGAYVSQEVLIADIAANKKMYEAKFDENARKYIERPNKKTISDTQNKNLDGFPNDPLYVKALAIVIQEGEASISLIQRRCYVGYNHAKKAIEWMESMGYIAPSDGKTKTRTVFLTKGQFIKKYGPLG